MFKVLCLYYVRIKHCFNEIGNNISQVAVYEIKNDHWLLLYGNKVCQFCNINTLVINTEVGEIFVQDSALLIDMYGQTPSFAFKFITHRNCKTFHSFLCQFVDIVFFIQGIRMILKSTFLHISHPNNRFIDSHSTIQVTVYL